MAKEYDDLTWRAGERVLWVDFDRAKTLPENGLLTHKQAYLLAMETAMMDEFANTLVCEPNQCISTPTAYSDRGLQRGKTEACLPLVL